MGVVVFAKVQGQVKSESLSHYLHLYFTVVTFLIKFKIGAILQKNLSKHNCQKIWMVKTTTVQKIQEF